MGFIATSAVIGLLASTLTVVPTSAGESGWIVETTPSAVDVVAAAAERLSNSEATTFDEAFTGVAVNLTGNEARMLEQRADVVAVHPDVKMTLLDTQTSAPWHLSRLDQATAPADGAYTYPASAGAGVRVYVVDSGISANAGQLGARVLAGVSTVAGQPATTDCNGHGTHVAGIIASTTYGVAKKSSVVPVRVFDCTGSTSSSTVISGLDWIAANHPLGAPGVVNMSLGGSASSALDSAVQRLISRGFIVTVAAGNGGTDKIGDDACTESPARAPGALTVGATTSTDARATYSNFGSCLDLFAPGSAVTSLRYSDPAASVTMSGTSMAAPVVAGVAALAWAEAPGVSARQIEASVIAASRTGAITSAGTASPNRLVATSVPSAATDPAFSAGTNPQAVASQFDPGNIISDATFYDGGALTAAGVQSFLQQRVPTCNTGATCLMNYRQNTPTMPASTLCDTYTGATNERAADIIAKVGAACNISQKALLVLLEKEQSLVSTRSASSTQLAKATGFSCPDTAPCDPAFAGFFYQVYYAARQFQNYAATPTRWNYQAGRINNVLYHPDAARCGSAPVFIQNKATAGLYIYTPYQPNQAALNNLYGTGDACSSYGNRNFWRIFTDWFGSPTVGTSLMRTLESGTVYLVSGDSKHPIPSIQVLNALSPLGNVGYVSQRYLDGFTTRHTVGRTLRDPNGTIYFYDAGIKLPITSCGLAEDYGASCAADGYVQLTGVQADRFFTGPSLTRVLGTVEGARYFINDGMKSEILDSVAQASAGITDGMNVLTENAVAHLPVTAPIVRDSIYFQERGSGSASLLANGRAHPVRSADRTSFGVPSRTVGTLWPQSARLLQAGEAFDGRVTAPGAPGTTLLSSNGRWGVTAGGLSASPSAVAVSDVFVSSYPLLGTIAEGSFVKSPESATVYIVMPDQIRGISGWDALLALTPDDNPRIEVLPASVIAQFAQGPAALTAGTLVRSVENATVYFVNGVTSRIALSDFLYTAEAGFGPLRFAPDQYIRAYPLEPRVMSFGFTCGSDRYVAAGGALHLVSPELSVNFPFEDIPLDTFTCAEMSIGMPATAFIRTPDGSIYHLVDGQKRPISTFARFNELSGGAPWLTVHPRLAASIPTGPLG